MIVVNHLPTLDMLDVLHAVELVLNLPRNLNQLPSCLNQLPNCLNLPGSVGIVMNYSLLPAVFTPVTIPFPLCLTTLSPPGRMSPPPSCLRGPH